MKDSIFVAIETSIYITYFFYFSLHIFIAYYSSLCYNGTEYPFEDEGGIAMSYRLNIQKRKKGSYLGYTEYQITFGIPT